MYGDSLNDVANDNGGATSRVSLVLRARRNRAAAVHGQLPKDGTTWDWSSGAVPAAQLKNIASIKIQVTSASGRPDAKRRYARGDADHDRQHPARQHVTARAAREPRA